MAREQRHVPTRHAGDLLRELRTGNGSSLRGAAKALGVDPAYLSRIERGAQMPSAALSARAAAYYDADPERITLAQGRLPEDIVEILIEHPEVIAELRERYG